MEDNKVAIILLSALTELNILNLDFLPQELSTNLPNSKIESSKVAQAFGLSIYRLDFSAKIKEQSGEEKVIIIEVQKSKFTQEQMRFRKYLGKQYMNENFFSWVTSLDGKEYKAGIPILPIYFLGEPIEGFGNSPVIKINRNIKDRFTNEVIEERNIFIDALFHEGIIVNINALKGKRRDELEILLSIFDQSKRNENHHIMNVKEIDFPEKFRPIVRRLQAAAQVKEVRDVMIIEDDFLAELNSYEHRISEERRQKEEAVSKEKEAVLKEKEAVLQRNEAISKRKEAISKQKEAISKQNVAIRLLISLNMPKEEIAKRLEISIEEINKLNN